MLACGRCFPGLRFRGQRRARSEAALVAQRWYLRAGLGACLALLACGTDEDGAVVAPDVAEPEPPPTEGPLVTTVGGLLLPDEPAPDDGRLNPGPCVNLQCQQLACAG